MRTVLLSYMSMLAIYKQRMLHNNTLRVNLRRRHCWLICRTTQHAQVDWQHHINSVKGQCEQVQSIDNTKHRTQDASCFRKRTHRHFNPLFHTLLIKPTKGSSISTKNQQNPLAVCKRDSEIVTGGHFITDRSAGVSTMRSRPGDTLTCHNIGPGHQTTKSPKAKLVSGCHTENLI